MTTRPKIALLSALYFVQGLPYGFQATALPAYLREAGLSLAGIGFANALALPWLLKLAWAPAVDRWGSTRFGPRKSWIVPLQAGLALVAFGASLLRPDRQLLPLLTAIFLMNLAAATMDVAVDGLAVDLLEPRELGLGNVAQVVGFKIGMLTGGGLLVWASAMIGWRGLFLVMSGLVVVVLGVVLVVPEPVREPRDTPRTFGAIVRSLGLVLASRDSGWLLLVVATYKLGETLADRMYMPFLVDAGFAPAQIGLWVGTWGMLFSIAGSITGGLLAGRGSLLRALAVTATFRVLPLLGQVWLAVTEPSAAAVIAVTCAEGFGGGALTTALFAFMMSRVDRTIGATHFTALATVEVVGKMPVAVLSGVVASEVGYTGVFGLGAGLSVLFLALLPALRGRGEDAPPGGGGQLVSGSRG